MARPSRMSPETGAAADSAHDPSQRALAATLGDDAVKHAAWLYYVDEMSQADIAGALGLSRASVIKYLKLARDRGLVRVQLDRAAFASVDLARRLREAYELNEAIVLPDDDGGTPPGERLVRGAATYLLSLLAPGDTLGVAWGHTVYRLAEALPPARPGDVSVVQLIGSVDTLSGFSAEQCTALLAQKLGARLVNLHVPAAVSTAEFAERLRAEPAVARQFAALESCTKALFSVGACDRDSQIVRAGIIDAATMEDYRAGGAAGVLVSRFIDAAGEPIAGEIDSRTLSIRLDQLRAIPARLLVGEGAERIGAMRATLVGGYATHLITDTATAQGLLGEDGNG